MSTMAQRQPKHDKQVRGDRQQNKMYTTAQRQPKQDKHVHVEKEEGDVELNVVVEKNEQTVDISPKSSDGEHERSNRIKHGSQRLDKRSAKGVSGLPKKSGQGGKYTWIGSLDEASLDEPPAALDEKDPNYVDED